MNIAFTAPSSFSEWECIEDGLGSLFLVSSRVSHASFSSIHHGVMVYVKTQEYSSVTMCQSDSSAHLLVQVLLLSFIANWWSWNLKTLLFFSRCLLLFDSCSDTQWHSVLVVLRPLSVLRWHSGVSGWPGSTSCALPCALVSSLAERDRGSRAPWEWAGNCAWYTLAIWTLARVF